VAARPAAGETVADRDVERVERAVPQQRQAREGVHAVTDLIAAHAPWLRMAIRARPASAKPENTVRRVEEMIRQHVAEPIVYLAVPCRQR
jgi:hypothetical protein